MEEVEAWNWVESLYPENAAPDLAYSADEMVDAFMAGAASASKAMREALEKIAEDGDPYRSGYCQTDISIDPSLTAEEAQSVARKVLMEVSA